MLTFAALTLESLQLVLSDLAALHASSFHFFTTHVDGENQLQTTYPYIFSKEFVGGTPQKVIV